MCVAANTALKLTVVYDISQNHDPCSQSQSSKYLELGYGNTSRSQERSCQSSKQLHTPGINKSHHFTVHRQDQECLCTQYPHCPVLCLHIPCPRLAPVLVVHSWWNLSPCRREDALSFLLTLSRYFVPFSMSPWYDLTGNKTCNLWHYKWAINVM